MLLSAALLAALLAGCAGAVADPAMPPTGSAPPPPDALLAAGTVDYSCTVDADCAVKDVGNCCGNYPACVNKDSPTFPEQVRADCAKNDMSSVCGWADISACGCVDGRCASVGSGEGPVR